MGAQYILRFDDICPSMNWLIWDRIEKLLDEYNIKPIMAVIPDNKDSNLIFGPEEKYFWVRVRAWQKSGWTIALHGYQHHYETNDAGLLGINNYSEFSGLSYSDQWCKIKQAVSIFRDEGVVIDAWVAPAHSFDEKTIQILLNFNINVISDGFYSRPVRRLKSIWIPQQMWKFRDMPFGLWTICYHHNNFTENELKIFDCDVKKFTERITSLEEVIKYYNIDDVKLSDFAISFTWLALLRIKRSLKI